MKAPILRQLWPTTVLLSLGLWQPGVQAVEMPSPVSRTADISEFDLEKLMQIKVTSVSKRPESWFGSAAAIDVIIAEDIHRSSANNLPDALRGSPGLAVARQDSHTWAISPRGFNSELASKTLVLIDGRSVYAPLNAGVYWDAQDVVLEDINRIEVIRGPGGTLWGANAVNGVINITTKGAKDTQGLLVEGGGGSLERDFGTVRYGGQLGDHAWFRVYGKYFERENFLLPNGATAGDAWNKGQGGFRIDWEPSTANTFTLQGDLYEGHEHQTRTTAVPPPAFAQITNTLDRLAGGNVLGRWTHSFSADSQLKVQLYFDRTEREFFIPQEERSTVDLDVQHQFRLCDRQEIVWGLGYRWTGDSMRTNFA
ncbi:MAG TPA: TonB-dependent receptor plug domain-containing protein, partial [Verrucomicrobiae bacterium]